MLEVSARSYFGPLLHLILKKHANSHHKINCKTQNVRRTGIDGVLTDHLHIRVKRIAIPEVIAA